jgi:hypothetical protein
MKAWVGIDFSGNHKMWRGAERNGNVWIAEITEEERKKQLRRLEPVQALHGEGSPFQNLTNFLRGRGFEAAAIDAPFSVPLEYLPEGGHRKLLELIARIERPKGWPFPAGSDLICQILAGRTLLNRKPLRCTERFWQKRKISVRSTLWGGPRPGAPMTSACLTLLREAECPIWPWERAGRGLLVEAFPAAQLCQWKMSYQGYSKDDATASSKRKNLVSQLSDRIGLSSFKGKLEESADALDAVLCAFAALGVTSDNLVRSPGADDPLDEGLIAVCK